MRLNRPDTLNIVLGYRCNVECRHCCTSCGPREDEDAASRFLRRIAISTDSSFDGFPQLGKEAVLALIDLAAEAPTMTRVSFTGGEPVLFKSTLLAGLRRATHHGLSTRMVSNASWAKTPAAAERLVGQLADAGLGQLTLSCSDYHAEFIDTACLHNALAAALRTDIDVGFSVITRKGGQVNARWLRDFLGVAEDLIDRRVSFFETPVMATGRGETLPSEDFFDVYPEVNPHGRCDVAGRTPTVTPDGRLMACCGFPYREIPELDFGSIDRGPGGPMRDLEEDFLVFALRAIGPVGMLERLGLGRLPEFSNICQACRYLFVDPQARQQLGEYLERRAPEEIFFEEMLQLDAAAPAAETTLVHYQEVTRG